MTAVMKCFPKAELVFRTCVSAAYFVCKSRYIYIYIYIRCPPSLEMNTLLSSYPYRQIDMEITYVVVSYRTDIKRPSCNPGASTGRAVFSFPGVNHVRNREGHDTDASLSLCIAGRMRGAFNVYTRHGGSL